MALLFVLLMIVGAGREALAQTTLVPHADPLYSRLLAAIRQIQIIDNHAHPALPGDPEMAALTFNPAGEIGRAHV